MIHVARGLPAPEDVILMNAREREELEAKVKNRIRERARKNLQASLGLPDVAEWIEDNCYDYEKVANPEFPHHSNAPKILLQPFQKRILRKCFTLNPITGRFPYRTVVYSAPKKSGKSGIGGFVGTWFAACVEAPNNILILANDREQSSQRVFRAAKPSLYAVGAHKDGKYSLRLPNGSYVTAVTSDPEKEAGSSYGLTIWDELWGYTSERSFLLWDELKPIGTRTNSLRLIVTYAGFEDASDLLWKLYTKIFTDSSETQLAFGCRAVPELEDIRTTDVQGNDIPACYEVPEEGIFYFNDHEHRMPWQQGEHGEALIRETIGLESDTNTFRLTYNRWQKTEDRFLDPEVLSASFLRSRRNMMPETKPMTLACDAGWKHDCSAIAGVFQDGDRFVTAHAYVWEPKTDGDKVMGLDLWGTIGQKILELHRAGLIARRDPLLGEKMLAQREQLTVLDVWYDETQLHQVAMTLRRDYKILIAKFDQNRPRLLADTFLRQSYNDYKIDNIDLPVLKSHLEAARVKAELTTKDEVYRIVHGTGEHAKPNDLAVAQSMAIFRCMQRPQTTRITGLVQSKAKGWE
jgi:phage terminase large subunit-like protein